MAGKYRPLERYLRHLLSSEDEVTLTFERIEQILQDHLPPSAHEHRPWWGNQKKGTHVEEIAWMDAGWMVENVDLKKKWVKFVRQ